LGYWHCNYLHSKGPVPIWATPTRVVPKTDTANLASTPFRINNPTADTPAL